MFNHLVFNWQIIEGMNSQMSRLYAAAEKLKGITGQTEVAKLLNISPQRLNNWETRGISAEGLLDAQKIIGCDANWLKDGSGEMVLTRAGNVLQLVRKPDEVEIPQYIGIGGSMGAGLLLKDQPGEIQSWRVAPEWISKNVPGHSGITNLCIVTGFGPSMRPLFNPGDPLLVDRGINRADADGIYFFRVGDEGFIKHLQRVPGVGLVAVSENKLYRDWVITPDMDFEVFGKVIKVWCSMDL